VPAALALLVRPLNGKPVKLCTNKAAAEVMLADLVKKTENREAGIGDRFEEHSKRPLTEHLADYGAALTAEGDTAAHVALTTGRVRDLLAGCRFVFFADVDADRACKWLAALLRPAGEVALPAGQDTFKPAEVAKLLKVSGAAVRAALNRHKLPAVGHGKARRFPRRTVLALLERAAQGRSPETVNHYTRAARGFFRCLVRAKRAGRTPWNPWSLSTPRWTSGTHGGSWTPASCAAC
jgi:excisionase family DNA binding protein